MIIRYATSSSLVNMGSRNSNPWPFESLWRESLTLAIKVTRDLQDRAIRSPDNFSPRQAAAVLVRIFSVRFPTAEDWHRAPEEWLALVGSPEAECARIRTGLDGHRAAVVAQHLSDIAAAAVAAWVGGSIIDPSAEAVADRFLGQLASDDIVTVKYG
jgi:hypothetical protein